MMKTYLEHLMESDREYHFRIKMVEPIDEERLNKIEKILSKYELRDITKPEKTIIQNHPLDFQDVENAEVYIVDAVTGVPISSYILQQEIRTNLKISEKFVIVRSDNDPLEIETARLNAGKEMEEEASKKGLSKASLLDVEEEYPEAEYSVDGKELYGDEYNSKFLQTLADISANRNAEYSEPKGDGLFDWLHKDVEDSPTVVKDVDFNEDVESAEVKPVPWWKAASHRDLDTEADDMVAPEGNFDDDTREFHRDYEDEKGKKVKLSRETKGVRG